MILYHGTSSDQIDSILDDGIKPRGWWNSSKFKLKSKSNLVYLTRGWAIEYAHYASVNSKSKDSLPVIFEVDVSKSKLLPDEDFLLDCYELFFDDQFFANIKGEGDDLNNAIKKAMKHKKRDYKIFDDTNLYDVLEYKDFLKMIELLLDLFPLIDYFEYSYKKRGKVFKRNLKKLSDFFYDVSKLFR